MSREKMIHALVQDFRRQFPESTRAEWLELFGRLSGFTDEELSLLVSQLGGAA